MKTSSDFKDAETMLIPVYEEIMWLARRKNYSPSDARSWYTHVVSVKLRRHLRRFTGMVSSQALEPNSVLRLEHFKRIQNTLTKLVADHLQKEKYDPNGFVQTIIDCEQVHIVTTKENYEAMKAKGDYSKAGIHLVAWKDIAQETQYALWLKALKGRVSNAQEFEPKR